MNTKLVRVAGKEPLIVREEASAWSGCESPEGGGETPRSPLSPQSSGSQLAPAAGPRPAHESHGAGSCSKRERWGPEKLKDSNKAVVSGRPPQRFWGCYRGMLGGKVVGFLDI